jgi:cytosine deaminase
MISTNSSGAASLASQVARVGIASGSAHSAHTLFMPAKSWSVDLRQHVARLRDDAAFGR